MTSADIEAKVKEIICEQLEVGPEVVSPDCSFTVDLKADPLAVVELRLALEEHFGMEISEDDMEQIHTVGEAIKYIEEIVAAS